ncbi:MAG: multidrug ABC transporter permease [Alphaproteobacteria bacterium CG11_big_fil_rev_8_21_14_0_20_39_49]|nr:MAG: multidrug ABC transporter permease [Alphaproteobacteria bacterium CG11_big_fil_rev_8_21_14_0_20_39_49]
MQDCNFLGAYSLFSKEVRRFLKVYNQTLIIPVITSLLFLAVFSLALGGRVETIGTLPFKEFMAAGLIMMAVMQNAFANTSSSFIMGKVLGTIIDYLMPPLSAFEITCSMVLAGVVRGLIVGLLVLISVAFFIDINIHSIGYTLFFIISASMLLSLLGLFAGIVAETFDQMAAVTSYLITPMTFLSGTFYSIHKLPEFWQTVSHANPFFYMIDGFRYGLTGYHDGNLNVGVIVMLVANMFIWTVVQVMIKKGYRIKS